MNKHHHRRMVRHGLAGKNIQGFIQPTAVGDIAEATVCLTHMRRSIAPIRKVLRMLGHQSPVVVHAVVPGTVVLRHSFFSRVTCTLVQVRLWVLLFSTTLPLLYMLLVL